MERYTLQERIELIKIRYKNGENLVETVRKTQIFLGCPEASYRAAIKKMVEKFELLRWVSDEKNKTRARRSRTVENIAAVAEGGLRYRGMINDLLWPKLDRIDLDNKTALGATQATKPLIFAGKSFRTVLPLEEVITIGHRDLVI